MDFQNGEVHQNRIGHVMLLEGQYYSVFFFRWNFSLKEPIQGFQKLFGSDMSLCLVNTFVTATPN